MNLRRSILALTLFSLSISAAHGKELVAVFQPDLSSPYEEVFYSIVSGVKDEAEFKVSVRKIADNYDPKKLAAWLDKKDVKVIIALGSRGLRAAKVVANGRPIMAAASLLSPDPANKNIGGISLAADPDVMIAELKRLFPAVRKIYVVYSPKHNDWLIQHAIKVAENYDITLNAIPASDLRQAAIRYKSVLNELKSGQDALWLPLDPVTVENRTILPLILRVAWDRNLIMISSNAPHAKRGALFSTFPKNEEMGQSIAVTVNAWLESGSPDFQIKPLSELGLAINVRTAAHLGVKPDKEDLARYDLKFPQE